MIIMGIDPGLGCTGIAIIDGKQKILHTSTIESKSSDDISYRLLKILTETMKILHEFENVSEISIEDQFIGQNANTSLKIGMAKTCCILAAAYMGLPIKEYSPCMIKKIICGKGNGNADKQMVRDNLEKVYNCKIVGSNDVSDAIAVALTHLELLQ